MEINLTDIGKKFNQEWVFRDITYRFPERSVSAILGRNGSGKSTLLQLLAGNVTPTRGRITYAMNGRDVPGDDIFRHLAMAAPYLELIEDFTLAEMIRFHFSFKNFLPGTDHRSVTELLGFKTTAAKQIRQFSSGMKQRVKLAIALLSDVPLLLLDEPTMNLDQEGVDWYLGLIESYTKNRTVIICSNLHATESSFAGNVLKVEDFKK